MPQEPAGAADEVQADKSHFPLEELGDHDLLKLIQDKLKTAQLECERQKKRGKKAGFCRKLAKVIDGVFFVLYLFTVVVSQVYMFIMWTSP